MFMMAGHFSCVSGRKMSAQRMVPSRSGICTSFSTISLRSRGWETLAIFSLAVIWLSLGCTQSTLDPRHSVDPDLGRARDLGPLRDFLADGLREFFRRAGERLGADP